MSEKSFEHVLPNGKRIEAAATEDLFQVMIGDARHIRQSLVELISTIDRSMIAYARKYEKLAGKRGRLTIIMNENLDPVDVVMAPREGKAAE